MLAESREVLTRVHDLAMLDLDGVAYVGPSAVPGAPEHLTRAREAGLHLAFVTNNASRTPQEVARHLTELGIDADAPDVVTSAQAAARLLVDRHGAGARIFVVGGRGLHAAVEEAGLEAVHEPRSGPVGVVTGYGPDVPWLRIVHAALLIGEGVPWVASNTDRTFPTGQGIGPGHGVQVRMLAEFTGVTPQVAGKPEPPLLEETIRRVGGRRPLMVGDRLDTDIEGAHRVGVPSLLVLTGVTGLAELAGAERRQRPTYLAPDLGGLTCAHPLPEYDGGEARLGGWSASVPDGRLEVHGSGEPADWWRVAAAAVWRHLDETGSPADVAEVRAPTARRDTVEP